MESAFAGLKGRGAWPAKSAALMRSLWYLTSNDQTIESGQQARRWGNKTPGSEKYLDFYENIFQFCPPQYIYALRDPHKVFLSVRNMPWGKNAAIKGQINRYCQSVKIIEEFKAKYPEKVLIFQIDKAGSDNASRLTAVGRLLDFLGEQLTPEVESFVSEWKQVHSTGSVRRKETMEALTELPERDVQAMARSEDLLRIMNKYGYSQTAID